MNSIKVKATDEFPFYMYLQQKINVKIGRTNSTLTIQNFIETFYYTVEKLVRNQIKIEKIVTNTTFLFSILNDNWNVIIKINR